MAFAGGRVSEFYKNDASFERKEKLKSLCSFLANPALMKRAHTTLLQVGTVMWYMILSIESDHSVELDVVCILC